MQTLLVLRIVMVWHMTAGLAPANIFGYFVVQVLHPMCTLQK